MYVRTKMIKSRNRLRVSWAPKQLPRVSLIAQLEITEKMCNGFPPPLSR